MGKMSPGTHTPLQLHHADGCSRSVFVFVQRRNQVTYQQRKKFIRSFFGKSVTVIIDRPAGFVHKEGKYPVRYRINYGHVPEITGEDGEPLEAYILGVKEPLETFTGRLIGIVSRENDMGDKLVVAPENAVYNQAQIAQKIHFQEKYYRSTIDSVYQKSCGAVIYRNLTGENEYLVLLQKKSHTWSLPKGHVEAFESERQTAMREVREEAGYKVNLARTFRHELRYTIAGTVFKSVVLYLAKVRGEPTLQKSEISSHKWATAEEAKKLLFVNYHPIIDAAEAYIAENSRSFPKKLSQENNPQENN